MTLGGVDRRDGSRESAPASCGRAGQTLTPWAGRPEAGAVVKAGLEDCARGREQACRLRGP